MRILVVTQYFWPEEFRINELAAALCERGHQVTVLTGKPNYPEGKVFANYCESPGSFVHYEGASVVRVPMIARGSGRGHQLVMNYISFALSASLFGLWKLRGQPFDVVLAYEPSPITVGIPAAVISFVKKAPLALWVLDLWPETLRALGLVRSERLLDAISVLVSWIYGHCDLILAQSRSFLADIAQRAPKDTRAVYFPAWADAVFDPAQEVTPAREVPPAPANTFTVMFAGNIGEAQDFPAILDAVQATAREIPVRWIIVGDGRMASYVRREVEKRGLSSHVHLVGRHSLERMPEFFAHADALLVSLKPEPIFSMTIPGKLQAYFGAGIPVLGMLDGEGSDIVKAAGAGLVCPAGDGAALAKIVIQMASIAASERAKMGRSGKAYCDAEFDFAELVSKIETELLTLIG